jgi:hypothetical protein
MGGRCTARAVVAALLLLATQGSALDEPRTGGVVPRPFEPLRVDPAGDGALEVSLWGRRYRFDGGPLPSALHSQGTPLLHARPRYLVRGPDGEHEIRWQPPVALDAHTDVVRLRSSGAAPGLRIEAETRIEYDGMVAVALEVAAERATSLLGLRYELPLASSSVQFYSHHLPYDARADNVDKSKLLDVAGLLPERLALDFVPTLALGDRRVGIEWWSETDAHWSYEPSARPFEVVRSGEVTRLSVTPVAAPIALAPGSPWRDAFAVFVFPARPPSERWRSVRILPYNRAAGFSSRIGTRFVFLAMHANFLAQHDGLPAAEDARRQRELREELEWKSVDYMPYGTLMLAPMLHPAVMSHFPDWSAGGKWWRIYEGYENAVIRRTHPEVRVGDPYTYPVCAARADYFDWILEENVKTLREERIDALYFDHGVITRMCVRNPALAERPGRQSWEYRNLREFYKRLYERAQAVNEDALIVIHGHGAPKALGAFVHFHLFGEALNGFFGGGRTPHEYQAKPALYTPDYLSLPDGYLDANFFPPVGGVVSLIPQIRWASEKMDPERVKKFQRTFQALVLSNDAHAPFWVSDLDTADEIYRAVDRFGDIGDALVHPWWANGATIRRPAGLRATAWVRDDRALLVLANLGQAALRSRIEVDLAALGVAGARRVRDLERPDSWRTKLDAGGFEVDVPPRDLRVLQLE